MIFIKTAALLTLVCASTTYSPTPAEPLEDDGRDRTVSDYEIVNSEDTVVLAASKEPPRNGLMSFALGSWFKSSSRSVPESLPTEPPNAEEDAGKIDDAVLIDSQTSVFPPENGTVGNATDLPVESRNLREENGILNNWFVAVVMMFVAGIVSAYMKG